MMFSLRSADAERAPKPMSNVAPSPAHATTCVWVSPLASRPDLIPPAKIEADPKVDAITSSWRPSWNRLGFGKSTLGEAQPGTITRITWSPTALRKYLKARATPHPGQKPWGGSIHSSLLYLDGRFVICVLTLPRSQSQPNGLVRRAGSTYGKHDRLLDQRRRDVGSAQTGDKAVHLVGRSSTAERSSQFLIENAPLSGREVSVNDQDLAFALQSLARQLFRKRTEHLHLDKSYAMPLLTQVVNHGPGRSHGAAGGYQDHLSILGAVFLDGKIAPPEDCLKLPVAFQHPSHALVFQLVQLVPVAHEIPDSARF